uniref:Uncharacterized protein n=1 Tax=Odontella aurita TaxID=265563 RepID=A0A7S4MQV7_9STRA|mmetsp:Transcript_29274/g.86682  ORF Transcript_29274/g.86682 Transcript_29274/m.86682 type:complete len:602 (+) Transcript_29274:558-2363(+)
MESSYYLMIGQCSKITRTKLHSIGKWEATNDAYDAIKILKLIKSLSHRTTDQKYFPLSLHMAKRSVYTPRQGPYTTNSQMVKNLKARVEIVQEIGGTIGEDTKLVEAELKVHLEEEGVLDINSTDDHRNEVKRRARDRYLAIVLLNAADRYRSGGQIMKELKNDQLKGHGKFPKNMAEGLGMLSDYSVSAGMPQLMNDSEGIVFSQQEEIALAQPKGRDKSELKLHICQKKGHYSYECTATGPVLRYDGAILQLNATLDRNSEDEADDIPGFQFLNVGNQAYRGNPYEEVEAILFGHDDVREESVNYSCNDMHPLAYPNSSSDEDSPRDKAYVMSMRLQEGTTEYTFLQRGKIDPNWTLLDTGSSIDVFSNLDLLNGIRKSDESTKIHCNTGIIRVTHKGTLPGYRKVWFNKRGISNILPMSNVEDKLPIMYYIVRGDRFVVQKPNEQLVLNQSQSGFYYHDIGNRDIVMVSTVAGNPEGYTDIEYAAAKEAKSGLALVGNPNTKDYINMVRAGLNRNFPITPDAVTAANKSFGPEVASLKGKTVRKSLNPFVTKYVEIPKAILELNKSVTLTEDVMFVNGLIFFVSTSRRIKFTTIEYIP